MAHSAVDDEVSKPFKLGFLVGFGCCVVAILHFKRCWRALVWFGVVIASGAILARPWPGRKKRAIRLPA